MKICTEMNTSSVKGQNSLPIVSSACGPLLESLLTSKPMKTSSQESPLTAYSVEKTNFPCNTSAIAESKGYSVIQETNLKIGDSESPIYRLTSTDAPKTEDVLLLIPVTPLSTTLVWQPDVSSTNSTLLNTNINNSSSFYTLPSLTVPLQEPNCMPADIITQNRQFVASNSIKSPCINSENFATKAIRKEVNSQSPKIMHTSAPYNIPSTWIVQTQNNRSSSKNLVGIGRENLKTVCAPNNSLFKDEIDSNSYSTTTLTVPAANIQCSSINNENTSNRDLRFVTGEVVKAFKTEILCNKDGNSPESCGIVSSAAFSPINNCCTPECSKSSNNVDGHTGNELHSVLSDIKTENGQESCSIPRDNIECFSRSIEKTAPIGAEIIRSEDEKSSRFQNINVENTSNSFSIPSTIISTHNVLSVASNIENGLIDGLLSVKTENDFETRNVQSPWTVPTENVRSNVENSSVIRSKNVGQVSGVLHSINENVSDSYHIPSSGTLFAVNVRNSVKAVSENLGQDRDLQNRNLQDFGNKSQDAPAASNNDKTVADLLEPLYKHFKNNKCLLCGFESKSKEHYIARKHLFTHLTIKNFKCDVCGKLFSNPANLSMHKSSSHCSGASEFLCKCGKIFSTKGSLNNHKKKHTSAIKYTCSICNNQYVTAASLKEHYRTHTGEKPYVCTICNKAFRTNGMLRNHSLHHNSEKLFRCSFCDKAYNNKGLLTQHMSTHNGSPLFKCSVCNKSFNYQSNLSQHMLVHSDTRRHACEVCGMKFKFPHHLRNHVGSHH